MVVDTEDEDDEVKNVIQSTFHDVIQHEEEELMELLADLKDEADNDGCIGTLLEVEEELIDLFLTDEFPEGKPILSVIDELMKTVEGYLISKLRQHRLKMLMDDINSNRQRGQSIFKKLGNAQDKIEILFVLKQLVREELLSLEQFEQLSGLEQMDSPTISRVIKDIKVAKGIKFLHRKLSELVERGKTEVRNSSTGGTTQT